MHKTEIINVENNKWDLIISQSISCDFYHTRSYHAMETKDSEDVALLFVSYWDVQYIALPLVVRQIKGTAYFDCTSVYGYCGPISNASLDNDADALIKNFQTSLTAFFKKEQIIAVFSRLHPLINIRAVFNDFGSIRDVNKTVAIDLNITVEEQKKQYRKSNKSEINKLRKKKGYIVKKVESDSELVTFVEIYNETMRRVDASDYYFFGIDYFKEMLQTQNYEAIILIAKKGEHIAAGAVFTISNGIMQYHLAGTAAPYLNETPMKLILDEARLRSNSLQLDYLHLGGGVGGSDEDSLFQFKAGFSKQFFQYSTWQYIVNPKVYKELSVKSGVLQSNFFPLYRASNSISI